MHSSKARGLEELNLRSDTVVTCYNLRPDNSDTEMNGSGNLYCDLLTLSASALLAVASFPPEVYLQGFLFQMYQTLQ
jgi:hypothetical protein